MNLLDYIPYGCKNAVTYDYLQSITRMNRREIRHEIHRLRADTPIINLSDGNGFFRPLPEEKMLVERFIKQEQSRARQTLSATKGAREFVRSTE